MDDVVENAERPVSRSRRRTARPRDDSPTAASADSAAVGEASVDHDEPEADATGVPRQPAEVIDLDSDVATSPPSAVPVGLPEEELARDERSDLSDDVRVDHGVMSESVTPEIGLDDGAGGESVLTAVTPPDEIDAEPETIRSLDDLRRLHATGVGYIFNDSGLAATRRLHRADCALVGRMTLTRPKLYFPTLDRAERRLDAELGPDGWTFDPSCLREHIPVEVEVEPAPDVAPEEMLIPVRRSRSLPAVSLPRLDVQLTEGWLALAIVVVGGIVLWRAGFPVWAALAGGIVLIVIALSAFADDSERRA